MAKFKASHDFKGKKEKKVFEANKEIELTIKRAEEIQKNIQRDYPELGFELKRTDLESD